MRSGLCGAPYPIFFLKVSVFSKASEIVFFRCFSVVFILIFINQMSQIPENFSWEIGLFRKIRGVGENWREREREKGGGAGANAVQDTGHV